MKQITLLLALLLGVFQLTLAGGVKLVPLAGEWEFRQLDQGEWLPATVPGTVHTDLLANERIPDPFLYSSEAQLQWVGESDWEYRLRFDIPRRVFRFEHIELLFDGLDTYADIYLNDSLLISTDNMFRSWVLEVKSKLRQVQNELRIVFHSPIQKASAARLMYPYPLPAGNDASETKTSPYVRKAGYHFGWDWAPRYVTMGIWKAAKFRMWDEIRMADLQLRTQSLENEEAVVKGRAYLKGLGNAIGENELKIWLDGKVVWDTVFNPERSASIVPFAFSIPNPRRWWPRGYGEAFLYDVKCTVGKNGYVLDSAKTRLGLRTLELVREKDTEGISFYFKVNGQPIFAKGANWVPPDAFLPRSASRMASLFEAMDAARFNMLRVWGGGIYGEETLYDWADENGVLIWQDLAFANAMYPFGKRFSGQVMRELRGQVLRLHKHPSLALWCGNNEIEVAWQNWGWQEQLGYSAADSTALWEGYLDLFHKAIPRLLDKYDPGRPYISSSPLSNWGTPENFTRHNMHYWGVWHGNDDFYGMRSNVPRFMAEYGFISFPSAATMEPWSSGAGLGKDSPFLEERFKSYKGIGLVESFMEDWLGKPKEEADFLVLSQLLQAEAMSMGIRAQRARAPFCMGTLYWQLNDCWPGASWSTVDYAGEWKAAHYRVCELYQSKMVDVALEGDSLVVALVGEGQWKAGRVKLWLTDLKGKLLWEGERKVAAGTGWVRREGWALEGRLKKVKGKKAVLRVAWYEGDGEVVEMAFHAVKPSRMPLPGTDVVWEVEERAGRLGLRIKANAFVKSLELSVEGKALRTSDNYFDLAPGQEKWIEVKDWNGGSEALEADLEVNSLADWVR